jgi:prefoldin subunit 5
MNLTVETDCAEAVELIKQTTPNMTIYASRIQEIREILREREIRIAKVYREANLVSHELAKLGRVQRRTESWVQNYPQDIAKAIVTL